MVYTIFYVFLICFEVATGFAGNFGGFFECTFFYCVYVEVDGYLWVVNFKELSFEVEGDCGGFTLRVVPEFAGVVLYAGAVERECVEEVEVLFYVVDGVATCEGDTNVARAFTVEVSEAGDAEVATVEHVDRLTCFGFLDEIGVILDREGDVFSFGLKQHSSTPPVGNSAQRVGLVDNMDSIIMTHSNVDCNPKTHELSYKAWLHPLIS